MPDMSDENSSNKLRHMLEQGEKLRVMSEQEVADNAVAESQLRALKMVEAELTALRKKDRQMAQQIRVQAVEFLTRLRHDNAKAADLVVEAKILEEYFLNGTVPERAKARQSTQMVSSVPQPTHGAAGVEELDDDESMC